MRYFFLLSLLLSGILASAQGVRTYYIPIADSKVYAEERGHGKTVVLLHAGNCDHRMWSRQVAAFSKHFRVITCDLRGCGLTIDGDSTYLQADGILAVMDSLKIKKASFVGLSLGSVAATAFALAHPDRVDKLVAASPGLIGIDLSHDPALKKFDEQNKEAMDGHDTVAIAEAFVEAWADGPFRKPGEMNKAARGLVFTMVYQNIAKRRKGVHPGFTYEPTQLQLLPQLKMPVLVICGKKDMQDILMITKAYKKNGASVKSFGNCAHMVNLEQPAKFNREVLRFL